MEPAIASAGRHWSATRWLSWTSAPHCPAIRMDEIDGRLHSALQEFTPGARADLLRALTSQPEVRADRIRRCFERRGTRWLGELLIDLEEDDFLRAAVVEALRSMPAGDSG